MSSPSDTTSVSSVDVLQQIIVTNYIFMAVIIFIFGTVAFYTKVKHRKQRSQSINILKQKIPIKPLSNIKKKNKFLLELEKEINNEIMNNMILQNDVKQHLQSRIDSGDVDINMQQSAKPGDPDYINLSMNVSIPQEVQTLHYKLFGLQQNYLKLDKLFQYLQNDEDAVLYKQLYYKAMYAEPEANVNYQLYQKFVNIANKVYVKFQWQEQQLKQEQSSQL